MHKSITPKSFARRTRAETCRKHLKNGGGIPIQAPSRCCADKTASSKILRKNVEAKVTFVRKKRVPFGQLLSLCVKLSRFYEKREPNPQTGKCKIIKKTIIRRHNFLPPYYDRSKRLSGFYRYFEAHSLTVGLSNVLFVFLSLKCGSGLLVGRIA